MLIGPKGSPPVFVSVTEIGALVLPTLISPKSMLVVSIAMSVSTAATIPGAMTTDVTARPITETAAPTPSLRIRPIPISLVADHGGIN